NTPAHLAVVPVPTGAKNLGNFLVSGNVTLPAGNYVASSFSMNGGSTLTVTGGVAQIWVTGSVVLAGTANGGGQFTGFIYAPLGTVVLDGSVTGSVTGATTTLNSGSKVTFVASAKCP